MAGSNEVTSIQDGGGRNDIIERAREKTIRKHIFEKMY